MSEAQTTTTNDYIPEGIDYSADNFAASVLEDRYASNVENVMQDPKMPPWLYFGSDNSPYPTSTGFGRNAKHSYYHLGEPSPWDLYHTARYTPLGYRLTYGFADDVWNNNFGLKFPSSLGLTSEDSIKINEEIREHLLDIQYYDEMRKATAYDNEQGESLLNIYRQGDGLEGNIGMKNAPDFSKEVIRVEAFNRMDYNIPNTGAFGRPDYYNIQFWVLGKGKPSYIFHTDRAIRVKVRDIDYDQYKGQAILKACFSEIQIILSINKSMGQAAFRWGLGIPAIYTKGISKNNIAKFKTELGDPTSQKWLIFPSEFIKEVKMLGLNASTMDLRGFFDTLVDQVVAVSEIPRPILMGQQTGIVGSEVNERTYYAVLDKIHTRLEKFIRAFFNINPTIQAIFRKYNIKHYEVDWGLRQVRTDLEQADLDMKYANNAMQLANFLSLDEIREYLHRPNLESALTNEASVYAYGIPVELLAQLPPNLGQWRQQVLSEVINTPEERKAEQLEQNHTEQAVEQTNKENGVPSGKETKPKPKKSGTGEVRRRQLKQERKAARDIENEIEALEQVEKDFTDLSQKRIITKLLHKINELQDQYTLSKDLPNMLGVSQNTLSKVVRGLEEIKNKMRSKEKKDE